MAPTVQTGNLGHNVGNLKNDQGFVILPGVIQDMEEKNPTKCHVEGERLSMKSHFISLFSYFKYLELRF